LAKRAIPRLEEFKPQELSSILWGFAANGFFHSAFFTNASASLQRMELTSQQLANTLSAIASKKARTSPAMPQVLMALLPQAARQSANFSMTELTATVLAAAKVFLSLRVFRAGAQWGECRGDVQEQHRL